MADLTFLATCDLVALTRGRAQPSDAIDPRSGLGWVPADLALSAFGGIADPNPFGSLGDLRLIPDETTAVTLPGRSGGDPLRVVLADQAQVDGTPWECCPRTALRTAVQRLHDAHGLEIKATFEHEFLLRTADGSLATDIPFALSSLRGVEPFGTRLLEVLSANGLDPENWLPEYGPGQFEITVRPSGALVAADRAVLLREIVRDTASALGLQASFVPLPHPTAVGNGVHIHWSFWRDGVPVTYDAAADGGVSAIAQQAVAGVLAHAEALIAWTAPSQISALRLTPHRWSAGGICIGERNREALVRICPIPVGSDAARVFNLEYRAADATANPHLALAALIHAMCDGLDAGLAMPPVVHGEVEAASAVRPLPVDLNAAIAALRADEQALRWFAEDLVTTHLGIRDSERTALEGLTAAEQCERYARVY